MILTDSRSEAFSKRIKAAVEEGLEKCGISARKASIAVVGHDGLIRDIRAGRMPSPDKLEALFELLGMELYLGPKRPDLDSRPYKIAKMIEAKYGPLLRVAENAEKIAADFYANNPDALAADHEFELDGQFFATVARLEVDAAAGNGLINFEAPPTDHLAFSKAWLAQNGIYPSTTVLITARGRSMEPSIYDGDLVMIDRNKKDIKSGRIYVFNDPNDGTRIKRLELVPGHAIIVRSDSPDQIEFPPEYYTENAMNAISENIVGAVVWSGHKWD